MLLDRLDISKIYQFPDLEWVYPSKGLLNDLAHLGDGEFDASDVMPDTFTLINPRTGQSVEFSRGKPAPSRAKMAIWMGEYRFFFYSEDAGKTLRVVYSIDLDSIDGID